MENLFLTGDFQSTLAMITVAVVVITIVVKIARSSKTTFKAGSVEVTTDCTGGKTSMPSRSKKTVSNNNSGSFDKSEIQKLCSSIATSLRDIYEDEKTDSSMASETQADRASSQMVVNYTKVETATDASTNQLQNTVFDSWISRSLVEAFKESEKRDLTRQSDSELEDISRLTAKNLVTGLQRDLATTHRYLVPSDSALSKISTMLEDNISIFAECIADFMLEYKKIKLEASRRSDELLKTFADNVARIAETSEVSQIKKEKRKN